MRLNNTKISFLNEKIKFELFSVNYLGSKLFRFLKYQIKYYLINMSFLIFCIFLLVYPYDVAIDNIKKMKDLRHDIDFKKFIAAQYGIAHAIDYMNKNLQKDALILSLRQAELAYYGKHRFLSEYDPILVNLYNASTTEEAYAVLKKLGVTYIYFPYCARPEYLNTRLFSITADPELAKLVFERDGLKLYKINYSKHRKDKYTIIHPKGTEFNKWNIVCARSDAQRPPYMKMQTMFNPFWLLPENKIINYYSSNCYEVASKFNGPYLLSLQAYGDGLINIYVIEKESDGQILHEELVWQGLLKKNLSKIETQFLITSPSKQFKIFIALRGDGNLNIKNLEVYRSQVHN